MFSYPLSRSILGWEITPCSDHAPLQWLNRMKDTNTCIWHYSPLRWSLVKVVQRSNGYLQIPTGAQLAVEDFLSIKGVCGEGGAVQRSLQWSSNSGDKRCISASGSSAKQLTPVSDCRDCRGENKGRQLIGHRERPVDSGIHTLTRLKAEHLKKVIYCEEARCCFDFCLITHQWGVNKEDSSPP